MNAATPLRPKNGRVPAVDDWRSALARRGERFPADVLNISQALRTAPDLASLIRYNEFSQKIEFGRVPPWRKVHLGDLWTDEDRIKLSEYLVVAGFAAPGRGVVEDCVQSVAREWKTHPPRDYLRSLTWDGEPRLQIWALEYLGALSPIDYCAAVGRKFLVSAVARIMVPGCQVDHVLVLEGPQGAGKTRCVQILGEPWTSDGLPDLHSKEAMLNLAGVWLVEIPELAALRRSEIESMKAFLSRREDHYRPPYGRFAIDVPRQCCFIATTNEAVYLRDPTGNRRFWPIRCGQIDLAALERDRDQLWAEAVSQYDVGSMWHLTAAETALAQDEQRTRVVVSELEESVAVYLDSVVDSGRTEVEVREVLVHALNLDPGKPEFQEQALRHSTKVVDAMERCGFQKVKREGRGAHRRTLYRLCQASPASADKSAGVVPRITNKQSLKEDQWDPLESTCRHASLSIL